MLRIRHLFININTDKGVFGTRQNFADGLNVIRAENWAGKSQVVQSIMYALGMEGMQGPSHAVPLAHAMTDYLDYKVDGKDARATVIDSTVSIEIENAKHEFLTVQRAIAGERHRHLMTVYEGRAITKKEGLSTARDITSEKVARPATNSDFIGSSRTSLAGNCRWRQGSMMLTLCSIWRRSSRFLYVEQKLGWGRLPARYPTWLGIRDVGRRTVEFLLGLDAYANALERVAVQEEVKRLRREWSATRSQAEKSAGAVVGNVRGIPVEPVASWPPEVLPTLSVMQSSTWLPIADHLNSLRGRLAELYSVEVPSTVTAEPKIRGELAQLEDQLARQERSVAALYDKFETETAEAESLQQRIDSINDDLRKYKDLRKVRNLGSSDEPEVVTGHCPTCRQELADSLLDTANKATPMTVDQNVSFYEEQIKLFTAVHNNAVQSIGAAEKDLRAQRAEVMRLRERIRDIRETLVSASSSPSIEAISERIRLQDRIGRVETQQQVFDEYMAELAELTSEWLDVQERLKKLPKGVLSERDIKKISDWQTSFQQQLTQYKMGSLDVSDVKLSLDTYEPEAREDQSESRCVGKRSHPAALGVSPRASRSGHASDRQPSRTAHIR